MRTALLVAGGFVLVAGVQLFMLSGHTGRYFAWTIAVPHTAAFFGSGYLASAVLEIRAALTRDWTRARIAVPGVLTFTVLTLGVTLLHLSAFHFSAPSALTAGLTWAWIIVYAGYPVLLCVALLVQRKKTVSPQSPGRAVPRQSLTAARTVFAVHALAGLPFGTALLVAPSAAADLWPWPLTDLTARAIGAWLIGIGLTIGLAARRGDTRLAAETYAVWTALNLVNLIRFDLTWSASAWIYLAVLVTGLAAAGGTAGRWTAGGALSPLLPPMLRPLASTRSTPAPVPRRSSGSR